MPDLTIRWDRLPAALARDGKHVTWDIKGRGGWQTTTLQDGKVVRVHGTCPFGRPLRWRASTGAAPDLRVTSEFDQKKGSSITQGKRAAMTLKVRNGGQYPAQGVALSIAPPTGLTVKSSAKGWSCSASDAGLACDLVTATLDAGATVNLPLQVTAARDAPDGTQVMTITPTAAGDAKGHVAKASLVVGDIGEGTLKKHRVAQVQLQAIEAPALGPAYGRLQASLEAPEAVEQEQIHGRRRARELARALLSEGNGSSVTTGTTGPGQGRDHPWADSCF
jgi:hypothetical protein